MPRSAGALRAEREVIRLCHSGLDDGGLQRLAVPALRRVLPVDAVFLATADPETLLFTGAWAEEPLDRATAQFLENEFGGDDVNKFAALATSASPVASLDQSTSGERTASRRYQDILRPLGLGDELRAALLSGPSCWGYLCLHREDCDLGFTSAELRAVRRLGPHLAHALRAAATLTGTTSPGAARSGVIVLDRDLTLHGMTPEAEEALSLIGGSRPLPLPVYAVAAALMAKEPEPSLRLRTRSGSWLRLHASWLRDRTGEDRVTVVVEPAGPRATTSLILSAHGLTRREAEVTTLVLRGRSTRDIADELHISANTVQDHLKTVFDKLGVHSRRDLVSHLLASAGGGENPQAGGGTAR